MVAGESDNTRKYEMQSVAQALVVMDLLTHSTVLHTLSHLSECLGMSRNKTFRILATLEERGVVERFGSGRYRFGSKAFALARRILVTDSLLCHVRPIMTELVEAVNESVYLATYKNDVALLEDMVDCNQAIKSASFVGAEIPFLRVPVKLSARSSRTEQKSFPGLVVEQGNLDPEITTVTAEFSDSVNSPAGALVVLAPTFRMNAERIRSDIAPALRAGSQRISVLLGKAPELTNLEIKSPSTAGINISPATLEFMWPINYRQAGSSYQPRK